MSRFNGLIQHSFALRNHQSSRSFSGTDVKEMVSERFAHQASGCGGFKVEEIPLQKRERGPTCSPLLDAGLTTLDSRSRARFFEWDRERCRYVRPLPKPFLWADASDGEAKKERQAHWERIVFAKTKEDGTLSINDLLVRGCDSGASEALAVSQMLCELLAARRSMLFGLALANSFVNVTLPYATLAPAPSEDPKCSSPKPAGEWILQPVISLIRLDRKNGCQFRRMYCLSFFLIPVKGPCFEARAMGKCEVKKMVNAGWGLSTCPSSLPRFDVSGPLTRYATRLEPLAGEILGQDGPVGGTAADLDEAEEITWQGLKLRKATEAITYAVATRMALGPDTQAEPRVRREIGDEVVSALGNSRVSSATVVDADPGEKEDPDDPSSEDALPGALGELMPALAGRIRVPLQKPAGTTPKYRLDRPYVDHGDHAIGVLPSNRSLIVVSNKDMQCGRWESGLMQAGWLAYSVIASASAIGTMRAINRDLEKVDRSEPSKVGEIEHEVSVDLHEIYDLDITWEAYRLRYRRLRQLLGITSDYKALHGKLDALYRETSAGFEKKAQQQLSAVNKALVWLSVLIAVVGILAIALN
jgi:hypothetical protein